MDETSYKERIIAAAESAWKSEHERQKREKKRKKKRKKPEEDVVKALLSFYKTHGFFVKRYESKAKFIGGEWTAGGLSFGTPDLMGVCPSGFMHAVEVKAPGRRASLRTEQEKFLKKVISCNGFAYVCDDVDALKEVYGKWISYRSQSLRRQYLISLFPKKVKKNDPPPF